MTPGNIALIIKDLESRLKTKELVIREIIKLVNHLESENDSLRQKLDPDSR